MKVIVVTEGDSEFRSLPVLYPQLMRRCRKLTIVRTMKITLQPDGPVEHVAHAVRTAVKTAEVLKVDRVVVVLDKERQNGCSGEIASAIQKAICERTRSSVEVHVVLKDKAYENWLVADLEALQAQPARFKITAKMVSQVTAGADNCDALALLRSATIGGAYAKMQDSLRICKKIDVLRAAKNSRSLRHLLHVLRHETYSSACKKAV